MFLFSNAVQEKELRDEIAAIQVLLKQLDRGSAITVASLQRQLNISLADRLHAVVLRRVRKARGQRLASAPDCSRRGWPRSNAPLETCEYLPVIRQGCCPRRNSEPRAKFDALCLLL